MSALTLTLTLSLSLSLGVSRGRSGTLPSVALTLNPTLNWILIGSKVSKKWKRGGSVHPGGGVVVDGVHTAVCKSIRLNTAVMAGSRIFGRRGRGPFFFGGGGGHEPLTWALFGENVCRNEGIWSCGGGGGVQRKFCM